MSGDDRIISSDAKASLETLESCVVVVVSCLIITLINVANLQMENDTFECINSK